MPKTYLIKTDAPDFTTCKDHLHYDGKGQEALGCIFATAVIATAGQP